MSRSLEEARDRFLALAGEAPPAGGLALLREVGLEAFAEQGLPDTKQEEWRYTRLTPLAEIAWTNAPAAIGVKQSSLEAAAEPVFGCEPVVFVDGRHRAGLPGGAGAGEVAALAESAEAPALLGTLAEARSHPFVGLNGALCQDGARVTLRGEAPCLVHLVFAEATEAAASHPRVLIEAAPGSRGTVIVDHVSLEETTHLANAVLEVEVGANASLDLVVLQRQGKRSFHAGHVAGRVERDGRLRTHTLTLGGAFVRNDLVVTLVGEGAECAMKGLYLGTGEELIDNHTWIDHSVPQCRSDELYKGVLAGRSQGVFRGRVVVRPDAQKTEAQQSNPNLLLSDDAEIDSKPQLEIYADDVKCSHGSAIGRLDPEALFYLRSRGIDVDEARALLTRGFAGEVLAALPEPTLAEAVGALFSERLERAGESP